MKTFHSLFCKFFAAILTICMCQQLQAQTYVVDSIAYQPYSFTAGRAMLIRLDDTYSQTLPIGFNFDFFGHTYSQIVAGSNGNLTFDTAFAGLYDPWALSAGAIPNVNIPLNSIFAAYRDIDNTNIGNITYQLLGTAPNRIFIVSYDSVPLYGSSHSVSSSICHDSSLSVFQAVLYEGCNTIEVYIHHSPSDVAWNSGLGIIGIQDSTGTTALAAPGRNNVAWTANDEAWRFSVSGTSPCIRASAGPDQTLCINHTATMQAIGSGTWTASGANPATVVITDPSSPATTVSGFNMTGAYTLTWSTAIDTSSVTVNVVVCSDSVWPGDADFNGLVDNDDLLPIGLGYDSTGPARAVTSIIWQAEGATDWTDSFANYSPAVNFKHADCNGDGTIDATDETAIYQNFSFIHAKTSGPIPSRSGVPTLYAIPSGDSVRAGDMLIINFVLADASLPVSNFYGLAFTYNFDPTLVDSTFTGVDYTNTWIGSTDKIFFAKTLHSTGEIKTAVTRIDHTSRSGYGAIGTATFRVRSDLSAQALTYLVNTGYISDIHAVDPSGHAVPLNAGTDTTIITLSPSGITDASAARVSIRPNPAHDKVNISADDMITEVSIINLIGQQVMNNSSFHSKSVNLDIANLDNGLYLLQIKTAAKTAVSRLIIEK